MGLDAEDVEEEGEEAAVEVAEEEGGEEGASTTDPPARSSRSGSFRTAPRATLCARCLWIPSRFPTLTLLFT